jgi:hypothetical protein
MDGGWDTGTWDSATWDFVPAIIDIDTHDGGKRQRKKFAEEVEEKARRRRQVVLAFEHIVEGRPLVAEEISAPFIRPEQSYPDIDAMMADLANIDRILSISDELDDEDVLRLI